MASIGAYSMLVFSPEGVHLQPARLAVAMLERNFAVDGNGVILGAYSTGPQMVRTVQEVVGSYATAATLANNYRKLIGTVQTVIDQFGTVWPYVTILDMAFDISAKAGFATTWRLGARWRLLLATSRP